MKRVLKILLMVSMIMIMVVACGNKLPKIEKVDVVEQISDSINSGISKAILAKNADKYQKGQYQGEAYEMLEMEDVTEKYREEEGKKFIRVYALVTYGEYNLENEELMRIDGSDVVPTIITFSKNDDDTFDLINYQIPEADKLQEMFPESAHEDILNIDEDVKNDLLEDEKDSIDIN